MNAIQNKSLWSWLSATIVAVGLTVALPPATARADDDDDDWEDRWEDYHEELKEEREESRERWKDWREDQRERWKDWDEHQREVFKDWREHRGLYRDYGPGLEPGAYRYPERYYYDRRSVPGYGAYYWEPRVHEYYRPAPTYRYYGSPEVGYSEFGHERAVRLGPFRVFWDDDDDD